MREHIIERCPPLADHIARDGRRDEARDRLLQVALSGLPTAVMSEPNAIRSLLPDDTAPTRRLSQSWAVARRHRDRGLGRWRRGAKQVAWGLPSELPCSVLVVLHMAAGTPSVLARIIDRSGPLPAQQAIDGEHLRPGRIYVAVPDRHLLVDDHRAVVSRGPTEDGFRPAINPLLRSAAMAYGPRAIGMLLSGVLDDGVLGLAAIRSRGGVTVVQDPDDALFPDMARNALAAQTVDHEVTAEGAGRLLAELVQRPCEETAMQPDPAMELENRIAMGPRFADVFDAEKLGPPSGYTCPDSSGSLIAVGATRYRCRVGHAWTPEALFRARDKETESAL